MKLLFLGLTISSSWGNGHATTYRSLCRALAARGHRITFVEKDVSWYRDNRDLPNPPYCSLLLYDRWAELRQALLRHAREADAVVIGSYFTDAVAAADLLFDAIPAPVLFYDIDTPVTIAALRERGRADYLVPGQIPQYRAYMSFTGGPLLREIERRYGAPFAAPLYCSVDPGMHRQTALDDEFICDLGYLGTYAPDRQTKLMRFLNDTAERLPDRRFLVAGPMYPESIPWAANVARMEHVPPPRHPAFYSSCRFTLNLTRQDMVAAGYSPSVRLFEAAACGAAMISDAWPGIDEFFRPGLEVLVPGDPGEVAGMLTGISDAEARRLGEAARARVLEHHTSAHRAQEFEAIIETCLQSPRSDTVAVAPAAVV
jgi:spore maturation protein CgeB